MHIWPFVIVFSRLLSFCPEGHCERCQGRSALHSTYCWDDPHQIGQVVGRAKCESQCWSFGSSPESWRMLARRLGNVAIYWWVVYKWAGDPVATRARWLVTPALGWSLIPIVQNLCLYFCVVGQTWTNSLRSFQTQNKDRFEGGPSDWGLAELYRILRTFCISARCHMACSLHKKAECRLLVDKMVIRPCDVQIKRRSDRGAPLAHPHSCSYAILVSLFVKSNTD